MRTPAERVSVIVPFAGSLDDARATARGLEALELDADDELILADNSLGQVLRDVDLPARVRVVAATGEGSPARARNAGALAATGDWLLFLDSDCRPRADLVETFFSSPIGDRTGLVAGALVTDPADRSLAAEYAHTRDLMGAAGGLEHPVMPWALTAVLLVRASVWRSLGGFAEGIFNGEDVDFSWRAQRSGWSLEHRPEATAVHEHRDTPAGLFRQAAVWSASAEWVARRWPEMPAAPTRLAAEVARTLAGVPVFVLTGRLRRARLKLIDLGIQIATRRGRHRSNRAREWPPPAATRRPVQVWCDQFPALSETFIANEAAALGELGHDVLVVPWRRPDQPALPEHRSRVRWIEDDTRRERIAATATLALQSPVRCLRDMLERRRWSREEPVTPLRTLAPAIMRARRSEGVVLHAHFARSAALNAMRVARIAGAPWTLTAHAFDIYQLPCNLTEKVRSAEAVTSGCDYTVRDLREIAGPERAGRVSKVVMGIDPERFRRTRDTAAEPVVLAIGRLVEKKGFEHLVRAVAEPAFRETAGSVTIVGSGPLEADLRALTRELGVEGIVRFAGDRRGDEVRDLLETAAVLAMPCVVASDGDRDSMPVVVKEALAMEVPVVCSDEVGLAELVRPEWGRLVPPADPPALARALAEILSMPVQQRAEMGAAGRTFVSDFANVRSETAGLSRTLEAVGGPGRS